MSNKTIAPFMEDTSKFNITNDYMDTDERELILKNNQLKQSQFMNSYKY